MHALMMFAALVAGVSQARGGMIINATYDSSLTSKSNFNDIKSVVNSAISFYQTKFTDNITVNITFEAMSSGLGENEKPIYSVPYSTYNSALRKDATSANDTTALSLLPAANKDPVTGQPNIIITQANAKALGIATPTGSDGVISINTNATFATKATVSNSKYDLYAVVAHEINEVLGLGSGLDFFGQIPSSVRASIMPEDLFRYDATGVRSFTDEFDEVAYLSINGSTRLVRLNQNSFGDYGNWYSSGGVATQIQNAFATPGVIYSRTMSLESTALDVIGYNLSGTGAAASSSSGARLIGTYTSNITPTPEPSVLALTLIGGLGVGLKALRRRKSQV